MQYELSSEVAKVAGILIKDHYPDLQRPRIVYLFQEKVDQKTGQAVMPKSKGKNQYGKAKLVTGLNAFLASGDEETDDDGPKPFFVILITKVAWYRMSKEHKAALVDHELMHCEYDSEGDTLSIRDHDIQEFTEIVKRHGVWNNDLEMFFNAAKQLPLPMAASAGNGKIVEPEASGTAVESFENAVETRLGRGKRSTSRAARAGN